MDDGNLTFEGISYEHLDLIFGYLKIRLQLFIMLYNFILLRVINIIISFVCSFKYVFIDPALVAKYGFNDAMLMYLEKKVDREKNHGFSIAKWTVGDLFKKKLNFKEIDIAPLGVFQVLENARNMELVTPFNIDCFAILQPYPDEISRLDVVMRPFKLPVWI